MNPWLTPKKILNLIKFMDLMLVKVKWLFFVPYYLLSRKVVFDIQLTYIVHYALFAAELFNDVQPLVQSALDGYNVSIFAYGQTHSGKTHTMVSLHIFCCACVPICILCPIIDIINFFLHLIMFGLINCLFLRKDRAMIEVYMLGVLRSCLI